MSPKVFQVIHKTAQDLFNEGHLEACADVLLKAKLGLDNRSEWEQLWPLVKRFPANLLRQSPDSALLYVRTLRCLGSYQPAVEWIEQYRQDTAFVEVLLEGSASLNGLGRFAEARNLLLEIIPQLSAEVLGIAWARLGFALFNLKEPWEEAYQKALPLLKGEERGRALLNLGYALSMSGQESKAHDVWLEALACFKNNAYFSAWIRYNLATTGLNNLDPQSERHLLAALHNTKKASAQGMQSPVWSGLARFRCLSGEWKRAEFAYLQSLNSAIGPADKQIAYRGLVTTYYLSGQQDKALETLEEALQEPGMAHFLLFVLQAKAYLKCGQIDKARAVLERVGTPNFEMERWEWRIAQAELARSQDHLDEAVALLEGLPLHTLHAREEVRLFPKLFALLEASGREIPKPLDYIEQTKVQVSAQGVLHVWVNNRPVEIVPTGRVGELLVYLLEQGGQTSLEHIAAAIYPEVFEAAKRRKLIWKLVNGLREALGWEDSVVALRGAYQLDPSALWHYDIAQARAKGEFAGEFLAGVYSQWVIEVGQELQNLAPLARRLALN